MSANNLVEFLESSLRTTWISYPNMDIYVRKSSRIHPILEKKITCLDIASVNVFEPGNGIFTKWLADTVDEASSRGVDAIYIENVLTERFANFFRKNGWIEKTNKTTSDLPSFFIVLKKP